MTEHEVIVVHPHAPARFRDLVTEALSGLAAHWDGLNFAYQAAVGRSRHIDTPRYAQLIKGDADMFHARRELVGARLKRLLLAHPLAPWMRAHQKFPAAAHTARLLVAIGDPLRFPGRLCGQQHHLPADYGLDHCTYLVHGAETPETCGAAVGPIRPGTGVRSLWHYCGLHVDAQGRMPRMRKGQQCTWNPTARAICLTPDVGLAAQIVRLRVEPWRGIYDATKARLARERGVGLDGAIESERTDGPHARPSVGMRGGAERANGIEVRPGSTARPRGGAAERLVEIEPFGGDPSPGLARMGGGAEDHAAIGQEPGSTTRSRKRPADLPAEIEQFPGGSFSRSAGMRGGAGSFPVIDPAVGPTTRPRKGAAEKPCEIVSIAGGPFPGSAETAAERPSVDVHPVGGRLRPFQIEQRARIVAVKALLGDLLIAWQRAVA